MSSLPQGVGLAIQVLAEQIKLLQQKNFIIAIDGYSSSGKSTLARDLSQVLNYLHVDSGAMYRAVTLYFIENKVDLNSDMDVKNALDKIDISFGFSNENKLVYLNEKEVTLPIRTMRVSDMVSEVAAISSVRTRLVQLQRNMAQNKGIIMDGRDIGTVVFPEADVKFFITASQEVRTERRYSELTNRGLTITMGEVRSNLQHRDHIDSTRNDSPLRQADDAVLIDTTAIERNEMLAIAIKHIYSISDKAES